MTFSILLGSTPPRRSILDRPRRLIVRKTLAERLSVYRRFTKTKALKGGRFAYILSAVRVAQT
jgi:hypothetical protein